MAQPIPALVASNLAWSLYMQDDAAVLDDAEEACAEAMEALPNEPAVMTTRGAILLARGKTKEGRRLLRRAYRKRADERWIQREVYGAGYGHLLASPDGGFGGLGMSKEQYDLKFSPDGRRFEFHRPTRERGGRPALRADT